MNNVRIVSASLFLRAYNNHTARYISTAYHRSGGTRKPQRCDRMETRSLPLRIGKDLTNILFISSAIQSWLHCFTVDEGKTNFHSKTGLNYLLTYYVSGSEDRERGHFTRAAVKPTYKTGRFHTKRSGRISTVCPSRWLQSTAAPRLPGRSPASPQTWRSFSTRVGLQRAWGSPTRKRFHSGYRTSFWPAFCSSLLSSHSFVSTWSVRLRTASVWKRLPTSWRRTDRQRGCRRRGGGEEGRASARSVMSTKQLQNSACRCQQ